MDVSTWQGTVTSGAGIGFILRPIDMHPLTHQEALKTETER